ncbi:uncharacterized protein [Argopecten irradians]|uniref:uncharacterized protein n=1 Tax=Argopecten irradians TaxID=31199 RepID=UPI003717FFC2
MALTVPENNFPGSLDNSDSNHSGGSESYTMYLTVGDGGYGVSTTMFGADDPGEEADSEEGRPSDTNLHDKQEDQEVMGNNKEKSPHHDDQLYIPHRLKSPGDELCIPQGLKSAEDGGLVIPENLKTQQYLNQMEHTDDVTSGTVGGSHFSGSANSSDTEDYSINSDDNEQTNNISGDVDGYFAGNQQAINTDHNMDLNVSIKTEPDTQYNSDTSTELQPVNSSEKDNTADFSPSKALSPSKAFSLRLKLFDGKLGGENQKLDFDTLNSVIAAAVSKTYNQDKDVDGGQTGQSKESSTQKKIAPKMVKSSAETKSGVVVVDNPIYIEGRLYHSCSVCQKMFKTPKELRVHSRIHTKEKPYACYVCGKAFRQQAHLNSHYKIHSGEKPYSCNLCSLSFTENSSLKRHIRIHLGIKPYKCDLCDEAFVTSYLLKTHKTRRHEEKQNRTKFACDRCPKVYTSKETFNKHLRSHNPDTRISCPYCGQVCLTSSHLKRHINVHKRTDFCNLETKDKPFECGICQKRYFNKKHLELHVVRHTQTETFTCDTCDKTFDSRYKWRRHLRRSHFDKLENNDKTKEPTQFYTCTTCSKVFRTNENLESHVKRVHEKPTTFTCDICNKVFLRRDAMMNHRESHLGQIFQCPLCEKSYSTSMTMKSHMRKKHGKTEGKILTANASSDIICEFCQRAFCNKVSLKEHIRTKHSDNVQLFTCSMCPMKFTRKNSLMRHMKKSCRMLNPDKPTADTLQESGDNDDSSPDTMDQSMDDPGIDIDTSIDMDSDDDSTDDEDFHPQGDLDTTYPQPDSRTLSSTIGNSYDNVDDSMLSDCEPETHNNDSVLSENEIKTHNDSVLTGGNLETSDNSVISEDETEDEIDQCQSHAPSAGQQDSGPGHQSPLGTARLPGSENLDKRPDEMVSPGPSSI